MVLNGWLVQNSDHIVVRSWILGFVEVFGVWLLNCVSNIQYDIYDVLGFVCSTFFFFFFSCFVGMYLKDEILLLRKKKGCKFYNCGVVLNDDLFHTTSMFFVFVDFAGCKREVSGFVLPLPLCLLLLDIPYNMWL